jgi:tetratricopeptide (TPR) repeat protein
VRVIDQYGRELLVPRGEWRRNVLPGNLSAHWNDPAMLYAVIHDAVQSGFAGEVIDASARLCEIDPIAMRSATMRGIVLMHNGRLYEAERVLRRYLEKHGDAGVVLTNLAKVYAERGDDARADETLWRALEADPNQDNAVVWFAAIHRGRGGEEAQREQLLRLAALPGSWRAQLWLARAALEAGDGDRALAWYDEALQRMGDDIPADALMQISGDLGKHGMLKELLRLAGPRYDPAKHGVVVGNNLIKANLDAHRLTSARRLLEQLYAFERPDWKEALSFWDREIARVEMEPRSPTPEEEVRVTILRVAAPLWGGRSPRPGLLPEKDAAAPVVFFAGSTVRPEVAGLAAGQRSPDVPRMVSRALPLFLAEQVALATTARAETLVPWVAGANGGLVISDVPFGDDEVAAWAADAAGVEDSAEFVAICHIDATEATWTLHLRLVRVQGAICVATLAAPLDPGNAAEGVTSVTRQVLELLAEHADLAPRPVPPLYRLPEGEWLASYQVRLEQLMSIRAAGMGGRLVGERTVVEGSLMLCVENPTNVPARMLLAEMLRAMNGPRPDVVHEFARKVALLQRQHPLAPEAAAFVDPILREVYPTDA